MFSFFTPYFSATGAILGNLCITLLHEKAILVSAGLLFIAFMIMFIDLEEKGEEI